MVATIKGQFLEQGTFNRKTGETVAYSEVLCEDNTVVQINDYIPPAGTKKFDPVNMWFDYPVHRIDQVGSLKDLQLEDDKPAWENASQRRKENAQKPHRTCYQSYR